MVRAQPGYRKGPQGTPSLPRLLPYKRRVKHMEDYYEDKDGRYGYCWCGCGEETNIPTHTDAQRGVFAGEPRAFLPGHHIRQNRPVKGSLEPERVEQIRYLWANAPMTSRQIGEIVGVSSSFTRAIAQNEAYFDPDYTPIGREERRRLLYAKFQKNCVICGNKFWTTRWRETHQRQVTCRSRACAEEHRRTAIVERNRTREWSDEERARSAAQMKEKWEQGKFDNVERPKTTLQTEWEGKLPRERPEYLDEGYWQALVLHVREGLNYEECARRYGGSNNLYKYRAKRGAEDLRRGSARPGPPYPRKQEAARRRRREKDGSFD